MENTKEQTLANFGNDDILLPDGYGDGVDIFDESTWPSAETQTDGSDASTTDDVDETLISLGETDDANANGKDAAETNESGADTADGLATPNEEVKQPTKHKIRTTIDHKDVEVDVDDSELAELYQKAHGLDRTREKLNAMTPTYEKSEMVKELLGYSSIDDMLDAAKKSYMDAEEEKLVAENVHPEVAKDIVQRKVKEIEEKVAKARKPSAETKAEEVEEKKDSTVVNGRDFRPEVAALLQAHPELKGKTLPNEVVNDSVTNGKTLAQAYADYEVAQAKAELDKLRKENKTLKHNAETAFRAPVSGVSNDGLSEAAADDFLAGFEEEGDYFNRGKHKK